jgi:hypothetical protein
MNNQTNKIKKIKQQNSQSNNLLQLADYVTGIIAGDIQNKKGRKELHKKIAHREIYVQIWPK